MLEFLAIRIEARDAEQIDGRQRNLRGTEQVPVDNLGAGRKVAERDKSIKETWNQSKSELGLQHALTFFNANKN